MQTELSYIAARLESAERQRRLSHMHAGELPKRGPRRSLLTRILRRHARRSAPSMEPVPRATSPADLLG